MKSTLLLVALFFQLSNAIGQIAKGTFVLNGTVSIENENQQVHNYGYNRTNLAQFVTIDDFNTDSYSGALNVGYFLTPRLAVGIGADVRFQKREEKGQTITASTIIDSVRTFYNYAYQFGPFARYYLINQRSGLFLQAQYLTGWQKDLEGLDASRISKGTIHSYSLGLGASYSFSSRIGVEALVEYRLEKKITHLKETNDPDYFYKDNSKSGKISLKVGFSYFISNPTKTNYTP